MLGLSETVVIIAAIRAALARVKAEVCRGKVSPVDTMSLGKSQTVSQDKYSTYSQEHAGSKGPHAPSWAVGEQSL